MKTYMGVVVVVVVGSPLYNLTCTKQWRFHCKRVPSGDEISFHKREFGQKNLQ
jgi:hypothetical protein